MEGEVGQRLRITKKLIFQIIAIVAILSIPSFLYTGAYIISDAPAPKEGVELPPYPDERLSEGLLFIVLDGGRKNMMLDSNFMPQLNSMVAQNGTYIEVLTNPLTMTASCVKEMATGIPSRPNEGLSNFHPEHPGTADGWSLSSSYDADGDGIADNEFGIVGDYVWGDLYSDNDEINFMKHRYGHADYMRGDIEAFETLNSWFDGEIPKSNTKSDVVFDKTPNVIVAHLSGLDSIGHRYGVKDSPEYEEKLRWLDENLAGIFAKVPDNWTVLLTADHSLTDSGQHGSPDEIIREVGAWMWGPNVKRSHSVEQIDQRDLATLPSLLLSLPLPHAIHGKFPLDALSISDEKKQVLEQWNWNATVERNKWMEENGHTYVEGLTNDVIEWEKISSDEIGLRSTDLILSGLFFSLICLGIMYFIRKHGFSLGQTISSGVIFTGIYSLSSYISFNRDTLAMVYYPLGNIIPFMVLGFAIYLLTNKDTTRGNTAIYGLFASVACLVTYVETRFSTLSLILLIMLLVSIFTKAEQGMRTSKFLKIAYTIVMIPTIFLSHFRLTGFSLPRKMIYLTFQDSLFAILFGSGLILAGILIFLTRNEKINNSSHRIMIAIAFTLIPTCMYFESNLIDWVLLSAIIVSMAYGMFRIYKKYDNDYDLIPLSIFFWLSMSWGGWAAVATIVMYTSIESFLKNEWSQITKKCERVSQEAARIVMITLLPIVVWFTWWAALGQIDGFFHPRDVDPGNVFLNGGYIGDRFSPSNAWVGFMGAGPTAAVSLLWWSLFHRFNWPVHYVAMLLIARIAMLSLQLSLSPNLPRLIFKLSWDIIFALGLIGLMLHVLISTYLEKRNQIDVEAI